MSFLEITALGRKLKDTWIASNVHFTQQRLWNIAIAGETGSGKSTVLRMIAGLVQPHTGSIYFEGERVEGPDEKLIPGHPGIAYLSQIFELPKFLRVEQVLQYVSKVPDAEAQNLFDICHITHLLKRRTDELSGGEQQRIALARLLIMRPKLLLLDEPFSNLDLIHKNILKGVLQEAQKQLELTCILTSHDPLDTLTWAHTVGVMKEGKVIQWGTPQQVYQQPINEYVAGLFGRYNLLGPVIAKMLLGNEVPKGNKLLVRPECFTIAPSAIVGTTAQVAAIRFAGAFYETDVWVDNQLLTTQTTVVNWKAGEIVKLSLFAAQVWVLPN